MCKQAARREQLPQCYLFANHHGAERGVALKGSPPLGANALICLSGFNLIWQAKEFLHGMGEGPGAPAVVGGFGGSVVVSVGCASASATA